MVKRICSIEGCENPAKTRGWCGKHYQRWSLKGTMDDPPPRVWSFQDIAGQRFGALVAVRREGVRWVCACDCGAESVVLPGALKNGNTKSCGCSRRLPRLRRAGAGYSAAHERVGFDRGLALDQICVGCGKPASHWAYDHTDPDEKLTGEGWPYSLNSEHYQPMCAPCHKRFDLDHIAIQPGGNSP